MTDEQIAAAVRRGDMTTSEAAWPLVDQGVPMSAALERLEAQGVTFDAELREHLLWVCTA